MPKYTPEQRAQAIQLADKHGPAEASRQTGIPRRTISSWRTAQAPQKRPDSLQEWHEAQRIELRKLLIEKAVAFADALTPGEPSARTDSVALGILIDKYRLEVGEVTDRTENRTQTDIDREIQARLTEWRRQFEPN